MLKKATNLVFNAFYFYFFCLNISYLIIFPDLVDEYQQYQDATADDDEDDEEEEYEQDGDY